MTSEAAESERRAIEALRPINRPTWPGVLKRTFREVNDDHLTDPAAALTYYGVLAIFPMLIAPTRSRTSSPTNVRQPGFRWVTPGGLVAVVLWIVASAAFAFFVGNFSSRNKTYGAIASVVVFLVWLWITNTVILLGAELNAEIERGRQIEGGHPAEREPYLPPRVERNT